MKLSRLSLIALLAAAVALAYSPTARAQDAKKDAPKGEGRPGGGRANVEERVNRMAEELKLTDDQKKKVEALFKEQGEKMRALRDATPEERREKGRGMREEMNKKMKEILTAEQYTKFEQMPRPGRPGGPEGEKKGEKKAEKN